MRSLEIYFSSIEISSAALGITGAFFSLPDVRQWLKSLVLLL